MKYLSIEDIHQHLRLDDDADDKLLELYGEAAEDMVLNFLNRTIEDLYEEFGKIPPAVMQATLVITDNSYQHRSPASPTNYYRIDYSVDALLKPYMIL